MLQITKKLDILQAGPRAKIDVSGLSVHSCDMLLHPSTKKSSSDNNPPLPPILCDIWASKSYGIGDKNKEHITVLHTASHPNMQVTVIHDEVIPLKP